MDQTYTLYTTMDVIFSSINSEKASGLSKDLESARELLGEFQFAFLNLLLSTYFYYIYIYILADVEMIVCDLIIQILHLISYSNILDVIVNAPKCA